MHAAWGRRAHRLEPDPEMEHVVRWMFAQRLAGHLVARIARALNDTGIPCPSAADPARNPHWTGAGWTVRTVASICPTRGTPAARCGTGSAPTCSSPTRPTSAWGQRPVQRWNLPDGWVISSCPAHQALVSEADFVAAQEVRAARVPAPRDGSPGTCWPGC